MAYLSVLAVCLFGSTLADDIKEEAHPESTDPAGVGEHMRDESPNWDGHPGAINFLTDDTFDAFREENQAFLAMFYAPWCGHCKALKPDFAAASETLKGEIPLAAIDCTQNQQTCADFGVEGYPDLRWFEGSSDPVRYEQARELAALIRFSREKIGEFTLKTLDATTDLASLKTSLVRKALRQRGVECPECVEKGDYINKLRQALQDGVPLIVKKRRSIKEINEERDRKAATKVASAGWEENGRVRHITFDDYNKWKVESPSSSFLVLFYTNWCDHCAAMKPIYVEASNTAADEDALQETIFAAIDCESNERLCKSLKISGYPTIHIYRSEDDGKLEQNDFTGSRDASAILNELRSSLGVDSDTDGTHDEL